MSRCVFLADICRLRAVTEFLPCYWLLISFKQFHVELVDDKIERADIRLRELGLIANTCDST